MLKKISLTFKYKGKEYCSLVSLTKKDEWIELRATIMNSYLDKVLSGNNVFQYKNGYLIVDVPVDDTEQARLKWQLITALDDYISKQPLNRKPRTDA